MFQSYGKSRYGGNNFHVNLSRAYRFRVKRAGFFAGQKRKLRGEILSACRISLTFVTVMTVSKTRTRLVDVARGLFAKQGLENTTMNDIAVASGKGRRTLYTYFKNKEDIYFAVIETELEHLSAQLSEVANKRMDLEEKLVEIIYVHLHSIKEVVLRNGNLRAEFFRNIWMVEKVRKHFDQKETEFFIGVLKEGVASGEFSIENVALVADVMHYCVKGLEVPYIYGRLGEGLNKAETRRMVKTLIHRALRGER